MKIRWVLNFALLVIPSCLPWYSTAINFNNSTAENANITKPGCPSKCGNLTVPYPFGIGINTGCSIDPFFDISCDTSFDPPKAFLGSDDLEVIGITDTNIRIRNQLAYICFDHYGNQTAYIEFVMNLTGTPFSISNENKLTVVGCDDVSYASSGIESDNYFSSCSAICSKTKDLRNGSCSGIGCCQASIPEGLQYIYADMGSLNDHQHVVSFNPCGYSFLAEQNSFTFQVSDISDSSFVNRTPESVPVLIDWAIGNRNCNSVENISDIICLGESVCVDSGTVLGGYHCNCSKGYKGNPYLSPGCQDINECEYNPCSANATCTNLPGSYNCSCPTDFIGDGMKDGVGCFLVKDRWKGGLYTDLGLGLGLGLFFLLAASFWLYKLLKKRELKKQRDKHFKRNGGLLLNQQSSGDDHVLEKMKHFTAKELERATDRFNESRILGRGGQGTVYKGMLSDGRIVAVKKSKKVDKNQLEEFINEVFILSQIKHRNIVQLLGCCLETEVPLLVYEFISNGTLFDIIHDDNNDFPFSWDVRMRIAAEVADALAYLHHSTSIPIYHRDMKSNNILLDEKYRAKVSDFGISRSVAIEQTHLTTNVKGTFGYLDPEYFRTSKFTEKSDVYSFGVVLVELLTGQKPISLSTTEDEKSLVIRFLLIMENNRLKTFLDPQISEQGVGKEHFSVAKLAQRCLNFDGKKRPTMREVAMELESIIRKSSIF